MGAVLFSGLGLQAAAAQDDPPRNRLNEKVKEPGILLPEQMPQFPGGFAKLLDELETSLKDPSKGPVVHNAGCWMVRFTVGADGEARAASVEPSPSNKISVNSPEGKAAQRALWSALKTVVPAPWKPGMQAGKPVAVAIELPLTLY
ncbi:hypothetical protein GCM10023185_11150 [Hymenobacter saemangeumensis]|uniref:TonB C-terminal domain-containing protein n=1 Tax=Hymenobacter saemangeumensis TaxID=1084522 RepID=A0ABP8I5S1_9BACT